MTGNFTLPIENFDGEGDDYDREIALIERAGRIKLRNKDLDAEGVTSRLLRAGRYANSPECKKDQAARTEAHRQRICNEEGLLRSRGINPCHSCTASKFDRL